GGHRSGDPLPVRARAAALVATTQTKKLGVGGKDSAYGRASEGTAYLTHNASGPSTGLGKLLALFYPPGAEEDGPSGWQRRTWRECLLLQRLGLSDEEVRASAVLHTDDTPIPLLAPRWTAHAWVAGAGLAAYRQRHAGPVLAAFANWLAEQRQQVLPKSAIGEAVTYAFNQWPTPLVYLT